MGKFLQLSATFIGGFLVAFLRGWLLTLVMISCIPTVLIVGAAASNAIGDISTKERSTHGEAGSVVEQTLGSIKTVRIRLLRLLRYKQWLLASQQLIRRRTYIATHKTRTLSMKLRYNHGMLNWPTWDVYKIEEEWSELDQYIITSIITILNITYQSITNTL